jgi:hypothetical protein
MRQDGRERKVQSSEKLQTCLLQKSKNCDDV